MANDGVITIDQLYDECLRQKALGNGSKKILISSDDEGNGYHQLWYGFTPTIDKEGKDFFEESMAQKPYDIDTKEYVILG